MLKKKITFHKLVAFFNIDQILFYFIFSFDVQRHFTLEREHMLKKKGQILLLNKHVSKRKVISQYIREVYDIKENGIVCSTNSIFNHIF